MHLYMYLQVFEMWEYETHHHAIHVLSGVVNKFKPYGLYKALEEG